MQLEFSRQFFEKYSNIKFHENPSSGSRVVPCGRTDMTNLIVALQNFANALNKAQTSMHSAGCEPAIPAIRRPQTNLLDRTATEIGDLLKTVSENVEFIGLPRKCRKHNNES